MLAHRLVCSRWPTRTRGTQAWPGHFPAGRWSAPAGLVDAGAPARAAFTVSLDSASETDPSRASPRPPWPPATPPNARDQTKGSRRPSPLPEKRPQTPTCLPLALGRIPCRFSCDKSTSGNAISTQLFPFATAASSQVDGARAVLEALREISHGVLLFSRTRGRR